MPSPAVEEFARLLVKQVRDAAITNCDGQLQPHAASPEALRWKQLGVPASALAAVIPDIVDATLFYLLNAIDQGELPLKFAPSTGGGEVDLTEEGLGEMGGWYMGSDGWRATYSEQRFFDDLADMK